ncbi:Uncharacterized protein dnm_077650 [Desulfonema magnum]|uniref:Tim44-like domain-containing protein n=2 Tax=Desulfonema magnum TaxID=45655 RepID=A0A975GS99_9BACT|nr:Uncharacterized protein dnm_077650 [Desulfonema magnum]
MNKLFQVLLIGMWVLFTLLIFIEPALAGPGGKIASAMFRSFWGKVLLAVLTVILLPFIFYAGIKEYLAERRTLKDLHGLAKISGHFDWAYLRDRIVECFYQVHDAWRREDMSEASEWMTDWYWRNQQIVFLDQWAREGLVNHCQVKNIIAIKPLFLAYRNKSGEHDESRIAVSVTAEMEDYLARRDTGEITEGQKGFAEVETVWSFVLKNDKWRVVNIEESNMSLSYAKLANELPAHTNSYELKR